MRECVNVEKAASGSLKSTLNLVLPRCHFFFRLCLANSHITWYDSVDYGYFGFDVCIGIMELVFKGEMKLDENGTQKGKEVMSDLFKKQLSK